MISYLQAEWVSFAEGGGSLFELLLDFRKNKRKES